MELDCTLTGISSRILFSTSGEDGKIRFQSRTIPVESIVLANIISGWLEVKKPV